MHPWPGQCTSWVDHHPEGITYDTRTQGGTQNSLPSAHWPTQSIPLASHVHMISQPDLRDESETHMRKNTYVHSHSVTKILRTLEPLGLFKSSKKFYFIFFVLFPSQWHQTRASQRFPRQHQCPSCITMAWKTIQRPKRHSFQLCFSKEIKWDVEEFLKDTFPRKKQIILAPYHGGNSLAPYHERNSLAPYHGRSSFYLDNISFVEENGLR